MTILDWLKKPTPAVSEPPIREVPKEDAFPIEREAYEAVQAGMKNCPICGGLTVDIQHYPLYGQHGAAMTFEFGCFERKRVITVQMKGTLGPKQ